MRIVFLSWEYPPRIVGGISPHVFELSQHLAKKGIEVHVVTKSTSKAPNEEIDANGIHVHRVSLEHEPNDFIHEIQLLNRATEKKCRLLLESWREEGKPTLFHAHDWLSLESARVLKYEYKLPMIATIHATEKGRNGGINTDMQRYIHEQEYWLSYEAWKIIVCSQFMKDQVISDFACPENKVHVIYNGINQKKFGFKWNSKDLLAYRRNFASDDEQLIIYVGRFVREKGIHVLLNAISIVVAEKPKTKFLIVGGGDRSHYENFALWYGLENHIHFTGFMANRALYQLYRLANVAVFPSLYEPFGIVALEGMAAEIPVVASNIGGLKEIVVHNQTGISCYAGDAQSCAWALLDVLKHPEKADQLVKQAKKQLKEVFNWEKIADQTITLYKKVWSEFLISYWAENSLWPVSQGAEERAQKLKVKEKAFQPDTLKRPARKTHVPLTIIEKEMRLLIEEKDGTNN